jgi:hypothetical protein
MEITTDVRLRASEQLESHVPHIRCDVLPIFRPFVLFYLEWNKRS